MSGSESAYKRRAALNSSREKKQINQRLLEGATPAASRIIINDGAGTNTKGVFERRVKRFGDFAAADPLLNRSWGLFSYVFNLIYVIGWGSAVGLICALFLAYTPGAVPNNAKLRFTEFYSDFAPCDNDPTSPCVIALPAASPVIVEYELRDLLFGVLLIQLVVYLLITLVGGCAGRVNCCGVNSSAKVNSNGDVELESKTTDPTNRVNLQGILKFNEDFMIHVLHVVAWSLYGIIFLSAFGLKDYHGMLGVVAMLTSLGLLLGSKEFNSFVMTMVQDKYVKVGLDVKDEDNISFFMGYLKIVERVGVIVALILSFFVVWIFFRLYYGTVNTGAIPSNLNTAFILYIIWILANVFSKALEEIAVYLFGDDVWKADMFKERFSRYVGTHDGIRGMRHAINITMTFALTILLSDIFLGTTGNLL